MVIRRCCCSASIVSPMRPEQLPTSLGNCVATIVVAKWADSFDEGQAERILN
jgi:hypothetical protein